MLNGSSVPEIVTGFVPPRVEAAKPSQNFTPLPEFGRPTITEPPPKYGEPTASMSSEDKALTDRLMAQIMDKPEPKKPQTVTSQIEKNIPKEAKKSLAVKIIEWFSNLPIIRWFFGKK
ncbi:MAG: hypothetical protein AAB437_03355 [Patescibacteria group bacterium]